MAPLIKTSGAEKIATQFETALMSPCPQCEATAPMLILRVPVVSQEPGKRIHPLAAVGCGRCLARLSTPIGSNALPKLEAHCNPKFKDITQEEWDKESERLQSVREAVDKALALVYVPASKEEWREKDRIEYMNSDKWKQKAAAVMRRDKEWCQACNSTRATLVHHLTYECFKNEPLFHLVAVCEPCHEALHKGKHTRTNEMRAHGFNV